MTNSFTKFTSASPLQVLTKTTHISDVLLIVHSVRPLISFRSIFVELCNAENGTVGLFVITIWEVLNTADKIPVGLYKTCEQIKLWAGNRDHR